MQNKTLSRIFRKGLGLNSRSDLEDLLKQLENGIKDPKAAEELRIFFLELMLIFEAIDQSFTDLDRTMYLRDSSLAISSREMTTLTEEIQAQAARQSTILVRLQQTVQLLKQSEVVTSSEPNSEINEAEMEKLVELVEDLVRARMDSAKLQQILYEEGLKICSVLSFRNLAVQLRSSIRKLAGPEIHFDIFFSGSLFEDQDVIDFYLCDDQNRPIENQRLSVTESRSDVHYLTVDSPQGNGTLAILQLSSKSQVSFEDMALRLSRISPLIPSLSSTLENMKLLKDEKQQQHMATELDTIRLVQQTLLPPSSLIVQIGDLEMSGYYQSATECSGDWWTHFQVKDGRHFILIGDVTGHGTGSAMVCAVVKGYCDSFKNRHQLSVTQVLNELNDVVFRMAKGNCRAMTMAVIAIDSRTGQATFANAGHPLPILIQGQGPQTISRHLPNSGPILGVNSDVEYKEFHFEFYQGDRIVLYSDGLTECSNQQDEMYGEHRLRRILRTFPSNLSAVELNKAIVEDVQKFSLSEKFQDDLTVVVIRSLANILCFADEPRL